MTNDTGKPPLPPPAGWYASLKNSGASLLAIGKTRLELLTLEFQAEKERLLKTLGLLLAAVFAAGLALILGIGTLVMIFWEQRLLVLGASFALCSLLALSLLSAARKQLEAKHTVLELSLSELEADIAALRSAAGQPPPSADETKQSGAVPPPSP